MRKDKSDCLPHFFDDAGNKFNVLSMSFCVDFGGRQCQVECQMDNGDDRYPIKDFTIYWKSKDFTQRDSKQVCDTTPEKSDFYHSVVNMFDLFNDDKEL